MRKPRIVIASVLKPVSDTRMFEKLATSLAADGKFEIFIIGRRVNPLPAATPGIHFICHSPFGRLSIRRLFAPWRIASKIRRLQADVIIITTHELLLSAISRKIASDAKIIYDVQENYQLNILHTKAFPAIIRNVVAWWVRQKEKLSTSFIDLCLFAEKCYTDQLRFLAARSIVIENKAVLPPTFSREPAKEKITLLFSGTLDETTGVFEAITLTEKLNAIDPRVQLHIIGYASRESTQVKIKRVIRDRAFIKATGVTSLVPHDEIIEAIRTAHFGLICYPSLPHTAGRTGTKVYEYLAAGLPILASDHLKLVAQFPRATITEIDFGNVDGSSLLTKLNSARDSSPDPNALWNVEGEKLRAAVNALTISI